MSVKVELERLSDALADYTVAYLVTVGDDHRAHVMAIDPAYADGAFTIDNAGNSAKRNAAAHPAVTLIWPPGSPDQLSLLVDGHAQVDSSIRVTPTSAVLHRRR